MTRDHSVHRVRRVHTADGQKDTVTSRCHHATFNAYILLLRPLAKAKYCNQFVCHALKYHTGQSRSSILPGWLMEQPSLFQTAGVYAGDMELVLSPSFRTC